MWFAPYVRLPVWCVRTLFFFTRFMLEADLTIHLLLLDLSEVEALPLKPALPKTPCKELQNRI